MPERIDRLSRVNELLKREIAGQISRLVLPPSPGMLISVTEVSASVDLRNASVGISIFGGDEADRSDVFDELHKRRSDFQRHLAQVLGFKHTPVLSFKLDRRMELGDRVLEMLNDGKP